MPKNLVDTLFDAAAKWAEENGGVAAVASGPHVIQFPDDGKYNYFVAVKLTGKPPEPEGDSGE